MMADQGSDLCVQQNVIMTYFIAMELVPKAAWKPKEQLDQELRVKPNIAVLNKKGNKMTPIE